MIDYFALALGHGLLAFALLRLVMREELDVDPVIESLAEQAEAQRQATSVAGRNARRRKQTDGAAGESMDAQRADAGADEAKGAAD